MTITPQNLIALLPLLIVGLTVVVVMLSLIHIWLHSLHSTLLSREVDWTQLDHVIAAVVAKISISQPLQPPQSTR